MNQKTLLGLFLILLPFVGFTQGVDSTHLHTLEEVEVKTQRKELDLLNLNSSNISKQMLLESFSNTFVQALDRLPGINSISTGVGIAKPVIRGLTSNRVIVTEYNIKQEGQQWGLDHGLEIDAMNVDKVEILKGPVSLLYGSDGIGGVINISATEPILDNQYKFQILTHYKSNNNGWGGSFKIEKNWGPIFLKWVNSLQDFAAYRVPADSFIYNSFRLPLFNGILKNTAGNEWSNSITIGFKDEKQKHQLTFSNFQQKTGLFIGAFGIPRSYNLLPAENNRKIDLPYQKVQHFKLISNHQWRNDYGLFKVDVGFQSNIRHEMAKPHAHNGITPIGNTSLLLELRTLTANMLHTKYFHPFTIQSGGQFQFQTNKAQGHEFLIPNYEQSQWGIFSLIKSNFKSNLQASAGVRWDMISQNIKEGILLWHDESGIEIYQEKRSNAFKRKYHNLSTGIGLACKFSTQTHINFNIGSAFRTPSISELSSNGIHHGTFRHEMGNENLLHEKGWLYDLQIHHKIKNGYIELSPFYNHFGNYIYLKPSGQFSPLPEAGQIYHYVNAPVTFYGAELLVHQHLLKYWQYNIIAEYVWNENRSTKNPLPFTPPLNLLTEVIFQPTTNSKKFFWKASANAHFFAAQNRTDLNEPKTESYLLSNVSLDGHWMLGKNKLSIFLQIKNLFNEHYYNNMSRYRILNLPEQGINFQLLMRYQF